MASNEKELIDKCTAMAPISESEWQIASRVGETKEMIEEFKKELDHIEHHLPPGFIRFSQWPQIIKPQGQLKYNLAVLRFKIAQSLLDGNVEFVMKNKSSIIEGMQSDPDYLDHHTFSFMIESLVVTNHLKAITIGLKLGQIMADNPRFDFSLLAPIMSFLVFPTVYDSLDSLPTEEDLRQKKESREKKLATFFTSLESAPLITPQNDSTPLTPNSALGRPSQKVFNPNDIGSKVKLLLPIVRDSKQILPMISLEMYFC